MPALQTQSDWFPLIEDYSEASHISIPVKDVLKGSLRLDAGLYASEGYQARQDFESSGFKEITLSDACSEIYDPPLFKRTYTDEEFGVPYINSSEVQECRPDLTKRYISKDTKNLDLYLIQDQDILITAAGTVGNVVIATADLAGAAGTSDIMRLRAHEEYLGTVYSALMSSYGQFLLLGYQYGSVVQRIRAHQVSQIIVPHFPINLRKELTRLIKEACARRVKANALLAEAQQELKQKCQLPDLSQLTVDNLIPTESEATVFNWNFNQRLNMNGPFGSLRIDATYHDPTACALAKYILASDQGTTLDSVLSGVRNSSLRKRVYVDESEQGIPLIGGKQLMQLRPVVKFLSKCLTRNIANETVKEGWTLVSCGGTLGRVQFVHKNYVGWAASQHVMRLIPDSEKIYSGYLYAFMASPFGQIQLQERSYGSVIPEIRDFQFNSIAICIPEDKGKSVHTKVVEAFDARADARIAEDKAIDLFMTAIREGKEKTESSWGRDY